MCPFARRRCASSHNTPARGVCARSAGLAVGLLNPMDCLRIRWQVTDSTRTAKQSLMGFARAIVTREGLWHGLWRPGLIANASSIALSSALRMGVYPTLRDMLSELIVGKTSSQGDDDVATTKQARAMVASSLLAGGVGYWITTPTFQMKVRLQAEAGLRGADGILLTGARAGHAPQYGGLLHGLARLAREEGLSGLYRGGGALVVRGALITSAQLVSYDLAKTQAKASKLIADGPALHVLSSIFAAFWMATLAAPMDVLMTRYQTGPMMGKAYTGLVDCARDMARSDGVRGFYRGWWPFFLRLAPVNMILFPIYEQLRRLMGLEYLN